jgi:hypothetical protein
MNTDEQYFKYVIDKSLNDVEYYYYEGRISQLVFEIYCLLWRNLSYRYSNILSQYELPENSKKNVKMIYNIYKENNNFEELLLKLKTYL